MKYAPTVQIRPFFLIQLAEMEYLMRLYLGLDNMTALSNEIVKVGIHYLLHQDLIKLHKMTLIFLEQRASLFPGLSPVGLQEVTGYLCCYWLKICSRKTRVCHDYTFKKDRILLQPVTFSLIKVCVNSLKIRHSLNHKLVYLLNFINLVIELIRNTAHTWLLFSIPFTSPSIKPTFNTQHRSDLLFLSLHCVSHVCFVLNHILRHTLYMCGHERRPSWPVALCTGQQVRQQGNSWKMGLTCECTQAFPLFPSTVSEKVDLNSDNVQSA